ncbi:hypothetical protein L3Q72_15485 [Vibrio sp. JC009]|uniref:hypothetical protein n=1 Tax=Vibrio sp. JC009 TaxID=2912314 RepID=UPI0023B17E17|nr:hypothetical protein [Vibrio sp. JC009]WED24284.1 hypothetical protein L3Q72_15485 [Vibrio sp. JC009]
MEKEYLQIDLSREEKEAILNLAGFTILDKNTKLDLENKRKKWIRFQKYDLSHVIGELSYHFNRASSDRLFYFLDELIGHLEFYEKSV